MLAQLTTRAPLRLLTSSLFLSTLPVHHRRAKSTVGSFTLDPSIFNRTLYKKVTDVWFPAMDLKGEQLDPHVLRRWFQGTPDERKAFDSVCREEFAHTLESIGPGKYPVAEVGAAPFLAEIMRVAQEATPSSELEDSHEKKDNGASEEAAVWTALSLTLLLDQIPRNIYRTSTGLRTVYTHYDTISYALTTSLLSLPATSHILSRPDTHRLFARSAAHRLWFYMPLMHSEDVAAHKQVDQLLDAYSTELDALPELQGSKRFLDGQREAEGQHREILDRFGRYPHRNEALGRRSTGEEEQFLKGGGATFGVGQGDGGP